MVVENKETLDKLELLAQLSELRMYSLEEAKVKLIEMFGEAPDGREELKAFAKEKYEDFMKSKCIRERKKPYEDWWWGWEYF